MILLNSQLQNHLLEFEDDSTHDQSSNERNRSANESTPSTSIESNIHIGYNQIGTFNGQNKDHDNTSNRKDHNHTSNNPPSNPLKRGVTWTLPSNFLTLSALIIGFFMGRCEYDYKSNANFSKITTTLGSEHASITTLLLLILGSMISYILLYLLNKMSVYYTHYKESKYLKQYEIYRKRIQMALGSIDAPSLTTQSKEEDGYNNIVKSRKNGNSKSNSNSNNDKQLDSSNVRIGSLILEKIVLLAEQHSTFLATIDKAIIAIRMVSSIQLGLGPSSLSIDRVEASTTHKQNRSTISTTRTSTINLKYIRKGIFESLLKEEASIRKIRNHIILMLDERWNEQDGDNNDDDDLFSDLKLNHTFQSSQMLTITLLKSMRVFVGELLSETLSLCFNCNLLPGKSHCYGSQSHSDYEIMKQLISSSTCLVEELETYIVSSLPGGVMVNNNTQQQDRKRPEWKQISQLQTYIDGVRNTTWAFQQSIQTQSQDDEKNKWSSETILLWKRLADEIRNVSDLYLSINNLHHNDIDNNMDCTKEKESLGNDDELQNGRGMYDKEEYDDMGIVVRPVSCSEKDNTLIKNKILVFSGKGAKSAQRSHQRMKQRDGKEKILLSTTSSSLSSLPPPSFLGNSNGRTMLLRELQSRLETLEKVEEWDAMTNQNVTITDTENSAREAKESKYVKGQNSDSSSFFLGASGSLLSELKDVLSNNQGVDDHNDYGISKTNS